MTGTADVTLKDATGQQFSLKYSLEGPGYKMNGTTTSVS
jgi:hypothetical protein